MLIAEFGWVVVVVQLDCIVKLKSLDLSKVWTLINFLVSTEVLDEKELLNCEEVPFTEY